MRKSGVLLPVSSLPSRYGIGAFSREAYTFIDLLAKAGQSYWQILPLGPTGYGDSPYQSFSTFAGNPYYIDLEALIEAGYLTKAECEQYDFGDDPAYVDYEKIYLSRFKVLKKAYQNSHIEEDQEYRKYVEENAYWLKDYALYMAVKNSSMVRAGVNGKKTLSFGNLPQSRSIPNSMHRRLPFISSSSICLQNSGLH